MAGGAGGKEVGRLSIRVVPDMDGFREKVESEARGSGKDVRIPVDADTKKAREKIRVIEDEKYGAVVDLDADARGVREKIKAETSDIHAKVKVEADKSSLAKMRAEIKAASREQGGSGASGLTLLLGSLGDKLSNFKVPDLVPNIGGTGAFASIGIIVAAVSLVAPALALLSQALVGLPALITAVALPLGVAALGFDGIKKALSAAGFLDIITGKAKKDGSTPKDKDEPGEVVKRLKDQISDVFSTGLTPVFKQMAAALPALTRGLPFVAQGLVKMAEGFGNIIATPAFQQGFDRLTNSIGTMLTNLSPALQLFASGMMNLITNVGDHLPGLGNKMTEWAGQFQSWVDRISKPQNFWGKDIANSSPLDKAIKNLGPEIDTLFSSIGNLVNRGLDLAGKGDMMKGIQDTFTGLEHLLGQLSRLGPVFESLATILNSIPSIGPGFDPKTPYGTKPGPAGSNTTIPVTHDEAMQQAVPFSQDPVQWLGDKAKGFLGHMFDSAQKFLTEQTIGGNLLSMVFGGSTPTAHADTSPFNAGKPSPGQAPIPVVPVAPSGGLSPSLQNLLLPGAAPKAAPSVSGAQAPDIKAPKIEAPKLPEGATQLWQPLIAATQVAGSQISQEVGKWSGVIAQALAGAASAAEKQGEAVGAGFAAGITASTYRVQAAATQLAAAAAISSALKLEIKSPSQVMKRQGDMFAQGFDDGMTGGFQGVIAKAGQLSAQVADAMKNGGVLSPQLAADTKKELQAIGIEYDKLKVQRDALDPKDKAGKSGIDAQMKQLQSLKDSLGLDQAQSKYSDDGKAGNSTQQAASMITQALASGLDAMKGFVMANVTQAEGDLGMSGNGVVEKLGDYGLSFLTGAANSVASWAFGGVDSKQSSGKKQGGDTYHFNSSSDEGNMQNYQRVQSQKALQYTQRSNV